MIGIAIATGCAGIIVGAITLTGLGLRMTDFVEFVSQGNILVMLFFTAFVCLVLGMGVPTTANYILVATLMAPVVVELGAQSGMVIPLIAVHLFVFYYGIMGDITPPVGLATLRRRRHREGEPDRRRHPGLGLRDPHGRAALHLDLQSGAAADQRARLVRGAAGGLRVDRRFAALRGGDDELMPDEVPLVGSPAVAGCDLRPVPARLVRRPDRARVHRTPRRPSSTRSPRASSEGDRLVFVIAGQSLEGEERTRPSRCGWGRRWSDAQPDGRGAQAAGGGGHQRVGHGRDAAGESVRFGSTAAKARIEQGFEIVGVKVPTDRINAHWFYIPGLLLVGADLADAGPAHASRDDGHGRGVNEDGAAMRLITDADVAEVITMRDAVAAMAAAFEQFGNGAGSIAPRVRAAAEHEGQTDRDRDDGRRAAGGGRRRRQGLRHGQGPVQLRDRAVLVADRRGAGDDRGQRDHEVPHGGGERGRDAATGRARRGDALPSSAPACRRAPTRRPSCSRTRSSASWWPAAPPRPSSPTGCRRSSACRPRRSMRRQPPAAAT